MQHQTKMSEAEAKSFQTFSVGNAARVKSALPCGCEPYEDVYTYNRWKAQGYFVRRGEHGVKIPVIVRGESKDSETGEARPISLRRTSAVFCRHQVEAKS